MKSVLFLFAQLLDSSAAASGGDVLSKKIVDYMSQDSDFKVELIVPKVAQTSFSLQNAQIWPIGESYLEKRFYNFNKIWQILPLYVARAVEALQTINKLSVDIVVTTGDFFCNVIPAWFYKVKHSNTQWVAYVYHVNSNPFTRKNYFFRSLVSYCIQRISFVFIVNRADVLFVLNKAVFDYFKKRGYKGELIISGAGIDVAAISLEIKNIGQQKKENKIVFLGRVNPSKGVFDLPAIMEQLLLKNPALKLDIIGTSDSETKAKLEQAFVDKRCLTKVTFHGFLPRPDVLRLVSTAQVFTFPSYEEGWGIVLFESILAGTIPVVYDLPVFKELFADAISSAPVGDIQVFSTKVDEVLLYESSTYGSKLDDLIKIVEKHDMLQVYETQKKVLLKLKSNA